MTTKMGDPDDPELQAQALATARVMQQIAKSDQQFPVRRLDEYAAQVLRVMRAMRATATKGGE